MFSRPPPPPPPRIKEMSAFVFLLDLQSFARWQAARRLRIVALPHWTQSLKGLGRDLESRGSPRPWMSIVHDLW